MATDKPKQVPVYLLDDKYADIKRLAAKRRLPLTRWIEEAIDSKIKKEDKKESQSD